MSGTAEPGWYDDGAGNQRWWDGTQWTGLHADFRDPQPELRTDAVATGPGVGAPGWYDDGRGRQRWWDGRAWTASTRYTDEARDYGGIVVDGRWIHYGAGSIPVREVVARVATVGEITKSRGLHDAVVARTLIGPSGPMRPGQFGRLDRGAPYLAVEGAQRLWMTPVPPVDVPRAQQFAAWVNACADHYRYR
jgi:hypothetical protein